MRTILTSCVVLALALSGCNRDVDWDTASDQERLGAGVDQRTVLFAPVAADPLKQTYPAASAELASDLAVSVNNAVTDARAWASKTLPDSANAAWSAGPVGAAAGADLVVLTEVLGITEDTGVSMGPSDLTAEVRFRILNAAAQEVWFKTVKARSSGAASPKLQGPKAQPATRATWAACKKGIAAIESWLSQVPGRRPPEPSANPLAPVIAVQVTSIPQGADILIDGVFKGNTPMIVNLPVNEVEVRIQRQGFQPWIRKVTASPEMVIQPALMPLGETAPAE